MKAMSSPEHTVYVSQVQISQKIYVPEVNSTGGLDVVLGLRRVAVVFHHLVSSSPHYHVL